MSSPIRKCIYCPEAVVFDKMKRQRGKTCAARECKLRLDRERKRVERAEAKAPAVPPTPKPPRVPGGFQSPWGAFYADEPGVSGESLAWADALLTGGMDGSSSREERAERQRLMDELP